MLTLRIPALRERPSDIQPLLELFVTKHSHKLGMVKPQYAEGLVDQLMQYPWPGNIRQLDNMVLRALTEMDGEQLQVDYFHLPAVEQ
ncbi:hypothetical protein ACT691_18765 [Vibrio metschnikovii]